MSTLREIIQRATPGPWTVEENMVSLEDWAVYHDRRRICRIDCWQEGDANAHLIARCNPQTMIAVIEALEDAAKQCSTKEIGGGAVLTVCPAFANKAGYALTLLNSSHENQITPAS